MAAPVPVIPTSGRSSDQAKLSALFDMVLALCEKLGVEVDNPEIQRAKREAKADKIWAERAKEARKGKRGDTTVDNKTFMAERFGTRDEQDAIRQAAEEKAETELMRQGLATEIAETQLAEEEEDGPFLPDPNSPPATTPNPEEGGENDEEGEKDEDGKKKGSTKKSDPK